VDGGYFQKKLISHGDDRGEGGTSTTANNFIHDLIIKVKGQRTGLEKASYTNDFVIPIPSKNPFSFLTLIQRGGILALNVQPAHC